MPLVKILPENLINQIAAGEVIERPSSVVKELVENSIDSAADEIILEILTPCTSLIRITDNGCGMSKEDAILAFERHATSKIDTLDDLFNIQTMGFRGEALASIASISEVILQTKEKGRESGSKIICKAGKIEKVEEIGRKEGTQIEVRDLFFNTPARKKYLKNEYTEYSNILETFVNIALSYPNISFKLYKNEKSVLDLPKTEKLKDRISSVLGSSISEFIIPVFFGGLNLKIKGYVGKPEIARTNRKNQFFYINNRKINNFILSQAVQEAFNTLLPNKMYPIAIIKLEINPQDIDVNVHPRKLEVRFKDQKEVFSSLYKAVKATLEKNILTPKITSFSKEGDTAEPQNTQGSNSLADIKIQTPFTQTKPFSDTPRPGPDETQEALNFTKNLLRETRDLNIFNEPELKTIPIGQIANSYILAEKKGEGIVIFDQHAAHERIMYTKLMDNLKKEEKAVQQLLVPLTLEVSHLEIEALKRNLEYLSTIGFEIETFSGSAFVVNSIPACLTREDIKEIMLGVLDDIVEGKNVHMISEVEERIIHYLACRSAVKFGRQLTFEEQVALIKQLEDTENKYTCPHGRPTALSLTYEDLEKKFKRT